MKITFHGAAMEVTGSKHLVETNGLKVLLDCGLHQGRRSEAAAKNKSFNFKASEIDAVVLSHAHADHCGAIPLLVKQGFKGKVYATPATRDVAMYIMLDSARIQEQDAEYFNKHLPEGEDPIEPLYDEEDVRSAMDLFEEVPYFLHSRAWTYLAPNVRFKFLDAGHILGSSIVVLESKEQGKVKTIAFSGDLGVKKVPLLRDPEIPSEDIDLLLLECTYGNRKHEGLVEARQKLVALVKDAFAKKRKIIVPAFSLGRTQEIVYILHYLTDRGEIPRIPIYVDSPLADNITEVFKKHSEEYDLESWQDFTEDGEVPFEFRNLIYTSSIEESKQLNEKPGPWMVISASGMCEAGRVLHHLANHISDPSTVIAFTGYQAKHTLGRKILEGESPVKIFGHVFDVRAQIEIYNELSAHADQTALLDFAQRVHPKKICLVHTEETQSTEFLNILARSLPNIGGWAPLEGESVDI